MTNKIPVLIWVYHVDLWPEILSLLLPIKDLIEPHIGLYKNNTDNIVVEESIDKAFTNYRLSYHNNEGADVLPFLHQLRDIDLNDYSHDIFLKIHTKKSLFAKKINWRIILFNSLIGSRDIFTHNIKRFADNNCGALTCHNLIMQNLEHTNSDIIQNIAENFLHIPYEKIKNGRFCGGNMFFGKLSNFKSFFDTNTIESLSEYLKEEKGKVNDYKEGTYSHSLERIFGYIVQYNNQKIIGASTKNLKVLNPLADNNKLHIITIYDGKSCYISEDINVYGNILSDNKQNITIEWYHLQSPKIKTYKYIKENTITSI